MKKLTEAQRVQSSHRRKVAQRSYNKKHWKKYGKRLEQRKKKNAYLRKYGKTRRAKNKARLLEFKAAKGCATCSEKDVRCLDFHHVDPKQKSFTISNRSMENLIKLQAEVEKCIVLCANCHRKLDKAYGN